MNVLITGCSRHSKEIVDCLKNNGDQREVRVIAVDMNADNILRHNTNAHYIVPRSSDDGYIPALIDICKIEDVDVVIPYITSELKKMALNKRLFEEHNIKLSVSSEQSIRVLNNKVEMYSHFGDYMPKQFLLKPHEDVMFALSELGYPEDGICCKIADSCGGNGFAVISELKAYDIALINKRGVPAYVSVDDLAKMVNMSKSGVIVQEYVPGSDYSVCVLADNGKIIAQCGYYGYAMEHGAVVNGEIKANRHALEIVERVTAATGLDGNACFDFIIDETGRATLLECNPRINASLGFCNAAGANLVYLRCKQLLGESIDVSAIKISVGLKMRKYYESEYYV